MTVTYAQAAKNSGGGASSLLFLGVLLVAFYFLGVRPSRKRMQRMQTVQAAIEPGREVVTTAGLYGVVTGVDDDEQTITLEIATGVEAKFARAAVMKVVEEAPVAAPAADGDD